MILKEGISGFSNNPNKLPRTNFQEFKTFCFQVARTLKMNLEDCKEAYSPSRTQSNFHIAWLSSRVKKASVVTVCLNAHYPVMAMASYACPDSLKKFFDYFDPSWQLDGQVTLTEVFETKYSILDPEELSRQLIFRYDSRKKQAQLEYEHELGNQELNQIYSWRPKCVAEIVFNSWD